MSGEVKKRRYTSSLRTEQAAATRLAVLSHAQRLFTSRGFLATSVADVAKAAGVNVDTVYASVGKKPQLLLAVIDMTLGSSQQPVPAQDRDYVKEIRAAETAAQKIEAYAVALGRLMPEIAPLFESLGQAALTDPACAKMRQDLVDRRAANMHLFAADLRATGELRDDLTNEKVADIVWSTNAPEFFGLLRSRGWSPDEYAAQLIDLWTRLLLQGHA